MGRAYPAEVDIGGTAYAYERVLKEDFFSVNVLYRSAQGGRYVLKLSDFRFLLGLLLRPLASLMSRHEYRIYERLSGIPGIPELGPRLGRRGYLHRFVEGRTLSEIRQGEALPGDLFEHLGETLEAIHAARVFYADLDKRGNIIVGEDGRPYLIDFQISLYFPAKGGALGRLLDRIFLRLAREDVYHLFKQKRRYQPELLTERERELARRSRFSENYNRYFGKPYRRLKRVIYPKGSNDIIWFKHRRGGRRRGRPGD